MHSMSIIAAEGGMVMTFLPCLAKGISKSVLHLYLTSRKVFQARPLNSLMVAEPEAELRVLSKASRFLA